MKNFLRQVLILVLGLPVLASAADSAPTAFYSGSVVDEQGRPVAGATVGAYWYPLSEGWGYRDAEPELTQRTVTGNNGVFALLPSPGATLAVVKKAGLATAWKTWSSVYENSSEPVVLTAPAPLAGIVLDESNHPVAGAEVWVTDAIIRDEVGMEELANRLFGQPARECFSARTGADGRFRIANFPADGYAGVAVKIGGKALHPSGEYALSREHKSGDDDIQLQVGPAGAVEGKVTVEETGQPLRGVKIKLEPLGPDHYGSEFRETIESGEDGSFRIPDVQPGEYNVRAVIGGQPVPDWVAAVVKPENAHVKVAAGETTRGVAVQASKGVLVEVSVVMTNDLSPVVGAPVWTGNTTVFTGINGMAMFRVPGGRNYFYAQKDWISQSRDAIMERGHVNNVWIQLLPSPTLSGTVRDPSGAPVSGALVSFVPDYLLFEPDPSEVTTDKNGRYEIILKLSRENREYIIGIDPMSKTDLPQTGYIAASDVGRNLVALHEFERIPTHLDINLQPGITLSGSVKDTNGAPVTNAAVDFRFWLNLRLPRWTAQPVKVNAQGCFSFPDMPQGRDYYVYQVAAKGYGTTSTEVKVALTQTNHYEFSPVVLEPADRKLAGHVLGLDGKPVARATVRFDGSGQPGYPGYGAEVETDRQGHFAFDAVCEGPVTVSVNLNDLEGSAHAHGGDTNVVVKLALQDGVPAASRVDPGPIPANQPSPTSQP